MRNDAAQAKGVEFTSSSVEIYRSKDGGIELDVRLQGETVWLSRQQMAELFQTDRTSVLKHINNIYKSEELEVEATCAKFAQVRKEGKRQVSRQIPFYNLDMIISVGYRINSKRGTQFRIWANNVLREYLIKGYAVNSNLSAQKYDELCGLVNVLARTIEYPELTADQGKELVKVVSDYTYALDTLDSYDYQSLGIRHTTGGGAFRITYENAMEAIGALRAAPFCPRRALACSLFFPNFAGGAVSVGRVWTRMRSAGG